MNPPVRHFRVALVTMCLAVSASFVVVAAPEARAAAIFTVNLVSDQSDAALGSGTCDIDTTVLGFQCTLRAAIEEANTTSDADTINFAIDGGGPQTIEPLSVLPDILEPVTIDGTTQPGFEGSPLVEVTGDTSNASVGLDVVAGDSTVKALALNGFDTTADGGGVGIRLSGNGSSLLGNYIGIDLDGTPHGNYWGIRVASADNTVGDGTAAGRNIISANEGTGLLIDGASATGNVVRGNRIGTNPAGTAVVGNALGVNVYFGEDNTIGGIGAGHGNLISGNGFPSLFGNVAMQAGTNNRIQGNFIGTDVTGTVALGGTHGISIDDGGHPIFAALGHLIEGNVIAGHTADGIELHGEDGLVQGNKIGVGVTGEPLPNGGNGIEVLPGGAPTINNLIGGTDPRLANVIAHNGGDGVFVATDVDAVDILGNSIHSNAGLGIDLAPEGVNANDPLDADSGANDLHNFPVIKRIVPKADATTVIKGVLKAEVGESYRLEFFLNNQADPSGFGEGQTFLASTNAATGPEGVSKFSVTVDRTLPPGKFVTATSTLNPPLVVSGLGGTSEFSKAKRVCTILGTGGPETLTGTAKPDVICGLGGGDELKGLGGADVLIGGSGGDELSGGDGSDLLLGQKGDDALSGGPNKDTCRQGPGKGPITSCEN